MIELKCPSCGANLKFNDDKRQVYFCEFCGAKVMTQDVNTATNNSYSNSISNIDSPDEMFKNWVGLYLRYDQQACLDASMKLAKQFVELYPTDPRADILYKFKESNNYFIIGHWEKTIEELQKLPASQEKTRLINFCNGKNKDLQRSINEQKEEREKKYKQLQKTEKNMKLAELEKNVGIFIMIAGIVLVAFQLPLFFYIIPVGGVVCIIGSINKKKYEKLYKKLDFEFYGYGN